MSIRNKATDRNSKGQIKRKYTGPRLSYWFGPPVWWRNMFTTRPRRRRDSLLMIEVMKGLDPDSASFSVHDTAEDGWYW